MTKPKPKKDDGGAAAAGDAKGKDGATGAGGADAKKKAAPKPRKRKVSDATATPKLGAASAAKRAATDESKGEKAADRAGAVSHAPAVDPLAAAAAAIKPFVKGELVETIKHMMFGFGDNPEPLTETAQLMEDLVVEHVSCMTKKAMEIAQIKGKLDPECFTFLISKDPELYERINELLRANDEFRAVLNSGFDPSDEKMY